MTDDEQAALNWLEKFLDEEALYTQRHHARTLKRMLAQPRLPENPTDELVEAMYRAYHKPARTMHGTGIRGAYRALYEILTKPRTKTVEVWRVEWALSGYPMLHQCVSEHEARESAEKLREEPHRTCIRVTGPHKQEVPA